MTKRTRRAASPVDVEKMWPTEGVPLTTERLAIWQEIRGEENVDRWRQVEELVRLKVGHGFVGWADL